MESGRVGTMETLEEYIEQMQQFLKKWLHSPQKLKREQEIEEECRKNGFWVQDGSYMFRRMSNSKRPNQVFVSPHGMPDEFTKLGYMHRHNYFEMMYVYRGSCVNKMPEDTINMNEGDILLLNPNVLHCPHVEHEEDVLLNICISNDLVQRNVIPILRDNPIFMSFFVDFLYRASHAKRFLYFSQNSDRVQGMCKTICLEFFRKQDFYESILESFLTALFALLAREYKDTYQISGSDSRDSQIYEILTYLEQHCIDITLESLSRKFQYSPSYLSRLIKKHTGKSFSEIVHEQKMERVAQYLGATGLPLTEIANLAGFYDVKHLCKNFKEKFGQTPTQYRKSLSKQS